MMRLLLLLAAVSLSLGCGLTSPCDKADEAANAVTKAASPCAANANAPKVKSKSECETAVKNCNEAEKLVIQQEMDCFIGLPACASGKEADFGKAVATCTAPVVGLSTTCKAGFGL